MRTIGASEITAGMRVRWEYGGIQTELTVYKIEPTSTGMYCAYSSQGMAVFVPGGTEVTVLVEPQPTEPTEFGALVVVDGVEYFRWDPSDKDRYPWVSREAVAGAVSHCWDQLTARGQVRVIPRVRRDNEEEEA